MERTETMTVSAIAVNGHEARIELQEKLTAADVPELQAVLRQAIEDGVRQITFDMSATTMLDSSGIGLLIAANNSLAAMQGQIQLVQVSPDIFKLLQSMRLTVRLHAVPAE
jgi:anti-anti-sigma factor